MKELLLYGYIGDRHDRCDAVSVSQFLQDNPGEEPILVRISSPGGYIFDGLATYSLLAQAAKGQEIPYLDPQPARDVHVMIDGLAASMATVIAMVGKTITIASTGRFMIHNPSGGVFMGDAEELRAEAARLDHQRDEALQIYTGRTGGDRAAIKGMMDAETWMTPQEAVDNGFCTAVVDVEVTNSEDEGDEATMSARVRPSAFSRLKGKAINLAEAAAKLKYEVPKGFAGIMVGACMVVTPPAEAAPPDPATQEIPAPTPTPAPAPTPTPTPTPAPAQEMTTMFTIDGLPAVTQEQKDAWNAFTDEQKATATAAATARTATMTAARRASNETIRTVGARMGATPEQINEQIDNMASIEAATIQFATLAAAAETQADASRGFPRIQVTHDATMAGAERQAADFVQGLSVMAANRARLRTEQVEVSPAQIAAADEPLWRIAARCLMNGGVSVQGRSEQEILNMAARMQGMHTQADFGLHITLGLNASAGQGYNLADNVNIEDWTETLYVDDFNEANFTSWGSFSGMRDIPEAGDYEQGTLGEHGAAGRLRKRGRDFTLSLEGAENKRLAGLSDIAVKMGQAARFDEQLVAEDTLIRGSFRPAGGGAPRSVYSVENKTQLPNPLPFGVTAFDQAWTLMTSQEEPVTDKSKLDMFDDVDDGIVPVDRMKRKNKLGLRPRLVGIAAEALPIYNHMSRPFKYKDADGNEYENPYAGTFTFVQLQQIDAKDYYFLDLPGQHAVVVIIRQRGKVGPEVQQLSVNNRLSYRWGVLNRIGGMIGSERGIVKGSRP